MTSEEDNGQNKRQKRKPRSNKKNSTSSAMENLQPPTPKEEVIVAKNPFETDFDLKCNSSMGGGMPPTSAPSMFHTSPVMMPGNSLPGNSHYFQKQYHSAYPPPVFGMAGPHTMGGPPGSSMMYPGMGPDNHPGNSPAALFHGGPNHPHGPPPHHPSHMTASSPMMRMPGGPPPGPPPGSVGMNAAAEMAAAAAFNTHLNPHHMMHPPPQPQLPSSNPVMRASHALPPEPPSPKRVSGAGGGAGITPNQGVTGTSPFTSIAGGSAVAGGGAHQTPQNSSASESGVVVSAVSGLPSSLQPGNPSASSIVDPSDSSESQSNTGPIHQQQQSLHHLSPMPPVSQMQQNNQQPSNNGPSSVNSGAPGLGSPASMMSSSNSNLPPGASPVNANAPITHLNFPICASCRQDILDGDDRLDCFSGCVNNSYHRMCAGLSKVAYDLFMQEQNVEWACDVCVSTRQVPLIKTRHMPPGHMDSGNISGGNNPGQSNFSPFNMSQQNLNMKKPVSAN